MDNTEMDKAADTGNIHAIELCLELGLKFYPYHYNELIRNNHKKCFVYMRKSHPKICEFPTIPMWCRVDTVKWRNLMVQYGSPPYREYIANIICDRNNAEMMKVLEECPLDMNLFNYDPKTWDDDSRFFVKKTLNFVNNATRETTLTNIGRRTRIVFNEPLDGEVFTYEPRSQFGF